MRFRTVATAGLAALTALTVVAAPTSAVAPAHAEPGVTVKQAPLLPLPQELDPSFYRPSPAAVTAAAPGQILGARRITPANFGLVPINVDAWQLSFRSTDTSGRAIPAVTTVLKPRGTTRGPRKVISMQLAEDSTAGYCATSYAVQQFNASTLLGQAVAPAELLIAQGFLEQGYAVVLPDHEGPNHAYAAGPLGARITLDSLRAAKQFAPSTITAESPIGLYGYSGGAIVTGHTAELKKSYAPELNIVGAAEGGIPADLQVVLQAAQNNITSGLILGAVLGLSREYDYFREFLDRRMNPTGKALMALKGPLCVQYQAMTFPFLNNTGMIDWPGGAMRAPAVKRVFNDTRMGRELPDMPMYMWNSALDEIIPVRQVDALVTKYCRMPGAQITYTRDHLSEHGIGEVAGAPMALLWLKDRLDGKPAARGCRTSDQLTMTSDARWWPTFSQTVGADLAALFGKALGANR
ncbi:lipase family protein [Gordonia sp. (in: high G+C Gram-positive bacteria)]|uniref:lipase family protein n=1 Tax=Gordonia sp. (in: high G+C Gram-positive bacteria) TaxID=84139 RepID=UPI0016BC4417|nr:lipase family protein [Gordonia sp. (in: high G+C Gram-positive bacteria)]NLG45925.1 triacylglycerol lipase [Gordonia sp. (in: high G+C Gram-positive bacteria)]